MPPSQRRRDQQRSTKVDVERTRIQERYRTLRYFVVGVIAVPLTLVAAGYLVHQFADVARAIAGRDTKFKFDMTTTVSLTVGITLTLAGAGWAAWRIRTQSRTTGRMRTKQRNLQESLDAAESEITTLKSRLRHVEDL